MTSWCPRCQQPYTTQPNSGDFVHECNSGQLELDQEDVVEIGTWTDYSGSGGESLPSINGRCMHNDLFGNEEGKLLHLTDYTVRGNKVPIMRQRQHYEHIPKP